MFQIRTLFYIRQLDSDIDKTLQEACLRNFNNVSELFQYSNLVVCPGLNSMSVKSVTVLENVDYLCPPTKQIVTSQDGDVLCGKNNMANCVFLYLKYLNLVTRKPAFGVSDQVRLKPVCSD